MKVKTLKGNMKYRAGMAFAAVLAWSAGPCLGATPPPRTAQWSQLANLPDWGGIWEVDWANKRGVRTPRPQMKLQPEYQKKLDAWRAAQKQGETLVVDSAGFTDSTQIAGGVPHSDKLRIVERIRKVSPEWMEIQTTLTDPVVLAEPFTTTASYRHLDDE